MACVCGASRLACPTLGLLSFPLESFSLLPITRPAMQEAETLCPSAEDKPWGTTVHTNILGAELGPWGILGRFLSAQYFCKEFLC